MRAVGTQSPLCRVFVEIASGEQNPVDGVFMAAGVERIAWSEFRDGRCRRTYKIAGGGFAPSDRVLPVLRLLLVFVGLQYRVQVHA